jgi:glycyl-tRNA synthetase (class II)
LASAIRARASATKSLRGTSSSGRANSSRWKWNSSASRGPIWIGSSIGKISALNSSKVLGPKAENLRFRDHEPAELAFYSKATTDVEYDFPTIGWGEILGVADRTDYDLKRHQDYSKEDLTYFDPETNEKYLPFVIEPSMGLDRLMLMTMIDAYDEEALEGGDTRVVMHLLPSLAPYKVAVLPLSKKLEDKANEVLRDPQSALYVHQRFDRLDRQTLSAPRRDWHPVLRDDRLRHRE